MFGKFLRDESGATAIEYSLLAGFIALAIIAAVGMTGQRLVALFESSHTCVDPALTRQATLEALKKARIAPGFCRTSRFSVATLVQVVWTPVGGLRSAS